MKSGIIGDQIADQMAGVAIINAVVIDYKDNICFRDAIAEVVMRTEVGLIGNIVIMIIIQIIIAVAVRQYRENIGMLAVIWVGEDVIVFQLGGLIKPIVVPIIGQIIINAVVQ